MGQELSGKTIVIFIACGVLTLVLFVIFAKRQIARFSLKSNRGPHVTIGHDAPKLLHREIDRRIERVTEIHYEPQVLTKSEQTKYAECNIADLPAHYYRAKAADGLAVLETEIKERQPTLKRHPSANLRKFLLGLLGGPLQGASSRLVHQFCDAYDHARYDPRDFGSDEYRIFTEYLTQLLQCVCKSPCSSTTTSSRTGTGSGSSVNKVSPKTNNHHFATTTVSSIDGNKTFGGKTTCDNKNKRKASYSSGKQVTFLQRPSLLSSTDKETESETQV